MSQDNNSASIVKIGDPCVVNKIYVDDSTFIIKTGLQGPPGIPGGFGLLRSIPDLDASNLEDGSVIVFDQTRDIFKTTRLLENQIISAGHY